MEKVSIDERAVRAILDEAIELLKPRLRMPHELPEGARWMNTPILTSHGSAMAIEEWRAIMGRFPDWVEPALDLSEGYGYGSDSIAEILADGGAQALRAAADAENEESWLQSFEDDEQ